MRATPIASRAGSVDAPPCAMPRSRPTYRGCAWMRPWNSQGLEDAKTVLIVIHLLIGDRPSSGSVLLQRSEGGRAGASAGAGGFMTGRGQANALSRATAILGSLIFRHFAHHVDHCGLEPRAALDHRYRKRLRRRARRRAKPHRADRQSARSAQERWKDSEGRCGAGVRSRPLQNLRRRRRRPQDPAEIIFQPARAHRAGGADPRENCRSFKAISARSRSPTTVATSMLSSNSRPDRR